MAKDYLIAQVTVTDQAADARYGEAAGKLLRAYGAKLIVRPDSAVVKEGRPRDRTRDLRVRKFRDGPGFWDSPEYTQAKALRAGAADGEFILMEGAE